MSDYFDNEKFKKNLKKKIKKNVKNRGSIKITKGSNTFYFFGFIGSAIYYISTATGFWMGVLGVLKSLVWPAFLVFEALKALGA
jgi:hypothetical protein